MYVHTYTHYDDHDDDDAFVISRHAQIMYTFNPFENILNRARVRLRFGTVINSCFVNI